MAITQNHVINIQPGVSAPLVIHCSQGDTGTQINLTVVNGDEEFDCSAYACSIHGTRSDRANWGPFTCNVSGSTVSFSLTSDMTAVAGSCLAEVSIGTVGTANFALLVENATFESGVTYSNDVSVYQNILTAVQTGISNETAERVAAVETEKNERVTAIENEKNERVSAVETEKNERVASDNSLSSRISQNDARINNLVGNTGNSNSEIVDARLGADSITYDTLGNSFRNQLKNSYLKINAISNNIGAYTIPNKFENGSVTLDTKEYSNRRNRIIIRHQKIDKSITLYVDDESYYLGIITWKTNEFGQDNFINDTGWVKEANVPANTWFTISLRKADDTDIKVSEYVHICVKETFIYNKNNIKDSLEEVSNKIEELSNKIGTYTIPNKFENGSITSDTKEYFNRRDRIIIRHQKIDKSITLYVDDESYYLGIITWKTNEFGQDNFINDTGWVKEANVPANTWFTISLRKADDTDIKVSEYVHICVKETNFYHTYEGEHLNMEAKRYKIEELWEINSKMADGGNNSSSQAFAIYNNILFQAFNPNKIKTFDFTTGEQLGEFDITIEHGDCLEFSNEMDGDFPLLYATSDSTPMKVYVNKVTKTSSELVRTYKFPSENTGYYGGHCTDFLNKKMYTVGYSNNSYYEDDGTNKMIVCVWDLTKTTANSDGTITPTLLETFELPFLITVQGQKFFNGKLFLVSSHWENAKTIIYVVDPSRKSIVSTISDLGNYGNIECEDIEFVLNESKTAYDMIVNVRYTPLLKLSFN